MTDAERKLVLLSAALSAGRDDVLDAAIRGASDADARAAEEVLLQSYLFLGYPAALNAMSRWRKLTGLRPPDAATEEASPAEWRARGEDVCGRVYAGQYDRLREHVTALHPELERWMLEEGYGKVLGRPGLDLRVRELCIVALLAGLDAVPQLFAHLRGALNVGATSADIDETLAIAAEAQGPQRAGRAAGVWGRVGYRI